MIEKYFKTISVITPFYNAEKFISRAIKTVQSQSFRDYEHIFINDGSTDSGLILLEKLAHDDNRIKIINLSINSGVVNARNIGISSASGRYLAFLDVDDVWFSKKLELQLDFMLVSNAHFSYSDYRFINESGSKHGIRLRCPNKIGWSMHHMTRFIAPLTVMVDREKCLNFSFGNISSVFLAEDFYAWSNIIKQHGPALRCPYDLGGYSIVENSRSSNSFKAAFTVWKLYRSVEKIPFFIAFFYFLSYLPFSFFKRLLLKPIFKNTCYRID